MRAINKNLALIGIMTVLISLIISCLNLKGNRNTNFENDTIRYYKYPSNLFGLDSIKMNTVYIADVEEELLQKECHDSSYASNSFSSYCKEYIPTNPIIEICNFSTTSSNGAPYIFRDYIRINKQVFCFDSIFNKNNLNIKTEPIIAELDHFDSFQTVNKQYISLVINNMSFSSAWGRNQMLFLLDVTDIDDIKVYSLGYSFATTRYCLKVDNSKQSLYYIQLIEATEKFDTLKLIEVRDNQLIENKGTYLLSQGIFPNMGVLQQ